MNKKTIGLYTFFHLKNAGTQPGRPKRKGHNTCKYIMTVYGRGIMCGETTSEIWLDPTLK